MGAEPFCKRCIPDMIKKKEKKKEKDGEENKEEEDDFQSKMIEQFNL